MTSKELMKINCLILFFSIVSFFSPLTCMLDRTHCIESNPKKDFILPTYQETLPSGAIILGEPCINDIFADKNRRFYRLTVYNTSSDEIGHLLLEYTQNSFELTIKIIQSTEPLLGTSSKDIFTGCVKRLIASDNNHDFITIIDPSGKIIFQQNPDIKPYIPKSSSQESE